MNRKGFTLVELSIVLVIVGLLVGGVLSGQSLIRAAELRSITADSSRYNTAINSFNDQYLALPGDIPNATTYWGKAEASASGTSFNCRSTAGTGTQTCNGNGDGIIEDIGGDSGTSFFSHEPFRAWQHLASAGLIEGQYTGISYPALKVTTANAPRGKISGSIWYVSSLFPSATARSRNSLFFGKMDDSSYPGADIIRAGEAYNIDVKMDDGQPLIGNVRASTFASCYTGSGAAATYSLSRTGLECSLFIALF